MGRPPKASRERTVKRGPYRFPPDVVEILEGQRNATRFICEAIRGGAPDLSGTVELEVKMVACRCGAKYALVNGVGNCSSGCDVDKAHSITGAKVSIPTASLLG